MPRKETVERARGAAREGKAPSTQAGEFVHEEIERIRHGEHGARSPKQAIAIGLSEARRAGVKLPPPKKGRVKERTRKSAEYAYEAGQGKRRPRVKRAVSRVLKRKAKSTVSRGALSRQAQGAARRRSSASRSAAARKAAQTKGRAGRVAAARKAAHTRARQRGAASR